MKTFPLSRLLLGLASATLGLASSHDHVPTPQPRVIQTAPVARTVVNEGAPLTLTVTATGEGSLNYQWYRNNRLLPGATGATYTDEATLYSEQGSYTVLVSDNNGGTRATGFVNVLIPN